MTFQDKIGTGKETWFLAQLKPNCLRIAVRNLDRQGFATFSPMMDETRRRNGRFETRPRPMFPGYLFVALDAAAGWWRTVNSTYGVSRLVSFGDAPTAVPDDLMSQIMAHCDASGVVQPPVEVSGGDRVRLTKGPFAGFIAEIERIDPDRRVWLLLDIMGGQKRVAARTGHVRPV